MIKEEAIKWIQEIRNGNFNRDIFNNNDLEKIMGSMAIRYWDNNMFSFGMEYGAIYALMIAFKININDI